jgi:hypothetical protein
MCVCVIVATGEGIWWCFRLTLAWIVQVRLDVYVMTGLASYAHFAIRTAHIGPPPQEPNYI